MERGGDGGGRGVARGFLIFVETLVHLSVVPNSDTTKSHSTDGTEK